MSSGVKLTNRFFKVNGFDLNIVKTTKYDLLEGILCGEFIKLVNSSVCLLLLFVILHIE